MTETNRPGPGAGAARALVASAAALALALAPAGMEGQEERTDGPLPADEEVQRVDLDEAVEIALRSSPSLGRAQADLDVAGSERTGAVGAFLPSLSLGYGFSDASTGRLDPTGQSITRQSWNTQLTASLPLFEGFRRFSDLDDAGRSLEARRADLRQQRFQTALDVKTAYFNAVAARERVSVEEDRVERQREQLSFVRQRVRLGRATRSDSLRSRVDLNDAQLALLNARNEVRSAQFALAEAMGVERRVAPTETATLEPDTLHVGRERLLELARERSPRVESALRSVEAAEASVASAKSSYLPSLQLTGGWAWQDADYPPRNRSWSLRLSGSVPLFNGFQRETQVARSRAQVETSRAQVRSARLSVRTDVDDAYSQLQTALAGLDLARESVELSREDLRVSQQRYRLGAATILDLQAAQIALQEAQVDLIRRQFDYQVALARLESVLGTDLRSLTGEPSATNATPVPDPPGASDTE